MKTDSEGWPAYNQEELETWQYWYDKGRKAGAKEQKEYSIAALKAEWREVNEGDTWTRAIIEEMIEVISR